VEGNPSRQRDHAARSIFPTIEPFATGLLPVDDLHSIVLGRAHCPDGVPVGRPAAGRWRRLDGREDQIARHGLAVGWGSPPLYGLGGALQKSIARGQARRRSLAYARRMRRALFSLLLLLCGVAAARADDPSGGPSDGLDYGPPVAVAAVLDGRTVGWATARWSASAARRALRRWQATARSVAPQALVTASRCAWPRWRRPIATTGVPGHLQRADGLWIEEELLGRGLARVDAGGADPAAPWSRCW